MWEEYDENPMSWRNEQKDNREKSKERREERMKRKKGILKNQN